MPPTGLGSPTPAPVLPAPWSAGPAGTTNAVDVTAPIIPPQTPAPVQAAAPLPIATPAPVQQSNVNTGLDPEIVNLTKAIRQTESGGNYTANGASGEHGAYQFTAPTWAALSQKYLGTNIPLKSATPEQQNEVAYKQIADWKSHKFNVGQIASMWNAGEGEPDAYTGTFSNGAPSIGVNKFGVKFNVPTYAKSVATAYQTLKNGGQVGIDPNNPSSTAGTQMAPAAEDQSASTPSVGDPTFSGTKDDSLLGGIAKLIGNIPSDILSVGKGAIKTLNPLNILKTIGQIPGAFKAREDQEGVGFGTALKESIENLPSALYDVLVPQATKDVLQGDTQQARVDLTNDPIGQILPYVGVAEGAAGVADTYGGGLKTAAEDNAANFGKTGINVMPQKGIYSQGLDSAISSVGGPVTDAIAKPFQAIASKVVPITTSIASHLVGLEPGTIRTVLSNPDSFSKIAQDQVSRGGLAGEVETAIHDRLDQLSEIGEGYSDIRATSDDPASKISVKPNALTNLIQNTTGLKIDEDGNLNASANSSIRNPSDVTALQKKIYDIYQPEFQKGFLTPNEFLNLRSDLGNLAKYDGGIGKSAPLDNLADIMRGKLNTAYRENIPGLAEKDAEYGPEANFLRKVQKDYLNPDGTFKDGAVNKIANAGGVGKDALLARLENLVPGITTRIKILEAVQDIEKTRGNKVGTYGKFISRGTETGLGYAAGGISGAVIANVIGQVLSHPDIAVPIIRSLGWTSEQLAPLIERLKIIGGDINNFGQRNNDNTTYPTAQPTTNQNANLNNLSMEDSVPSQGAKVNQSAVDNTNPINGGNGVSEKRIVPFGANPPAPLGKPDFYVSPNGIISADPNIPEMNSSIKQPRSSKRGLGQRASALKDIQNSYEPYTPDDQLPVIEAGLGKPKK